VSKPLVCASLIRKTPEDMVKDAEKAVKLGADLVEIRADYLDPPITMEKLQKVSAGITASKILTIRPRSEGGLFSGSEEERLRLIKSAIPMNYQYFDLELSLDTKLPELIRAIHEKNKQVIVSTHNFVETPEFSELKEILDKIREFKPDIAKIATTAKNLEDVIKIFQLVAYAHKTGQPIIAIAMGEVGKITRIVCPLLGAVITYASIGENKAAPGQLSVEFIKEIIGKWKKEVGL